MNLGETVKENCENADLRNSSVGATAKLNWKRVKFRDFTSKTQRRESWTHALTGEADSYLHNYLMMSRDMIRFIFDLFFLGLDPIENTRCKCSTWRVFVMPVAIQFPKNRNSRAVITQVLNRNMVDD